MRRAIFAAAAALSFFSFCQAQAALSWVCPNLSGDYAWAGQGETVSVSVT